MLHINDVLRSILKAEDSGRPLNWAYLREIISEWEALRLVGSLDLLISAGYINVLPARNGSDYYVLGKAGHEYLDQWG
ncbi:MAG TPA: hypothetical protein VMX12_08950 [Acidimicrobiia bacterium]|nr:hypothetical protein [Acidimicrobiia bacterium]